MTIVVEQGQEMTDAQAAARLGVSRDTLAQWRRRRKGPAFLKIVGRIKYRVEDIQSWLESCRIDPRAERPNCVRKTRGTKRGSR